MDLLRDAGPLIFSHLLKAGVELAHLLVRFPQLLFCLAGPARVLNRDGKAERLPRLVTDGGNVDAGPEPAPVLPPAPSLLLEAPLESCPLQVPFRLPPIHVLEHVEAGNVLAQRLGFA